MKTFIVTYNHIVFKPSSLFLQDKQKAYSEELQAKDLDQAKALCRSQLKKNPFYFNFTLKS